MDEHRIILQAKGCRQRTVSDGLSVETFLSNTLERFKTKVRHGPTIVARKGPGEGITGFIIGDHVFVAFSSNSSSRTVSVEVCAHTPFDIEHVRNGFLSHFMEDVGNLRVIELNRMRLDNVECEESGCSRTAVKDWHGRKVCGDHYDAYRDNLPAGRRNEWDHD